MTTVEQRLKQIIGEQTFAVVVLQAQIEQLTAENAKLKGEPAPDGMPAPKPVKK